MNLERTLRRGGQYSARSTMPEVEFFGRQDAVARIDGVVYVHTARIAAFLRKLEEADLLHGAEETAIFFDGMQEAYDNEFTEKVFDD